MIKKLQHKFIFVNMALVGAVLLCMFVVLWVTNYKQTIAEANKQLEESIHMANNNNMTNMPEIGFPAGLPQKGGTGMRHMPAVVVTINESGNIINIWEQGAAIDETHLPEVVELANEQAAQEGFLNTYSLYFIRREERGVTYLAFMDSSQMKSRWNSLLIGFAGTGAGALVVFFFISFFLSKWVVQPVKETWEKQQQFIADASHELKTPLTVILANTEIMLAGPEKPEEEKNKWLKNTQYEALRMKKLVENMLRLAKADSAEKQDFERVNFSDVVLSGALSFEAIAFEQNVQMTEEVKENIFVKGNIAELQQVVGILLDNALKYVNPMGKVQVYLTEEGNKVHLKVMNTGDVIAKEELPLLFDRFYKADKVRTGTDESFGLGLSIAKTMIEKHNGKIAVNSNEEKGTVFTVVFEKV